MVPITRPLALTAFLAATLPSLGVAQQSREADGPVMRSVLDGVYTAEQSRRGKDRFAQNCGACHTTAEFSSATFRRAWSGRTIYDLFEIVRTLMPYDSPGSLTRESYAEILAYFLELNDFPAGDTELPVEAEAQKLIRIERRSEETGG